jgi:hypothetical protein
MQSISLPIELWETILDNLSGFHDKTTLCACSLTCKAFLRASHRSLYYRVELGSSSSRTIADHFLRTIRSASSSTNPSSFVRHLDIRTHDGYNLNLYEVSCQWVNEALPILATCLLEVNVLKLKGLSWGWLTAKASSAIMLGFQKVKCLDLEEGIFETPEQMCQTIATFPALTHLLCPYMCLEMDDVSTTPLPRSLEAVEITSNLANHFDRLLNMEQHPNLRTIKLRYIGKRSTVAVGRLLRTVGSSLEHLDLGEFDVADKPQVCYGEGSIFTSAHLRLISDFVQIFTAILNNINLAHFVNLRSIGLDCGMIGPDSRPPATVCLFTLLSQIASPHMVDVRLRLGVADAFDLEMVDWHRMDQILTQSQWANLRQLTITWDCELDVMKSGVKLVCARLPRLTSRGVEILSAWKLDTGTV